jgi:MinD superfamily P-loop ATPase
VLGRVNEDHVVPELQLLERFHRFMVAVMTEAMDREFCFAAGSCMADGLCGRVTGHDAVVMQRREGKPTYFACGTCFRCCVRFRPASPQNERLLPAEIGLAAFSLLRANRLIPYADMV